MGRGSCRSWQGRSWRVAIVITFLSFFFSSKVTCVERHRLCALRPRTLRYLDCFHSNESRLWSPELSRKDTETSQNRFRRHLVQICSDWSVTTKVLSITEDSVLVEDYVLVVPFLGWDKTPPSGVPWLRPAQEYQVYLHRRCTRDSQVKGKILSNTTMTKLPPGPLQLGVRHTFLVCFSPLTQHIGLDGGEVITTRTTTTTNCGCSSGC